MTKKIERFYKFSPTTSGKRKTRRSLQKEKETFDKKKTNFEELMCELQEITLKLEAFPEFHAKFVDNKRSATETADSDIPNKKLCHEV